MFFQAGSGKAKIGKVANGLPNPEMPLWNTRADLEFLALRFGLRHYSSNQPCSLCQVARNEVCLGPPLWAIQSTRANTLKVWKDQVYLSVLPSPPCCWLIDNKSGTLENCSLCQVAWNEVCLSPLLWAIQTTGAKETSSSFWRIPLSSKAPTLAANQVKISQPHLKLGVLVG